MTQRDQRIYELLTKRLDGIEPDELREIIRGLRIELETERRHSDNQRSQIKSLTKRLRRYQDLEHEDIMNELKHVGSYSMLSPANMARLLRITFDTLEYPCIISPNTDENPLTQKAIFGLHQGGFFHAAHVEGAARLLNNINENAIVHEYKFPMDFWRGFYSFLEVHGKISNIITGGGFGMTLRKEGNVIWDQYERD